MKMLMIVIQEATRWHFIVQNIFIKRNVIKGGKRHTSLLLQHIFASFLNSDEFINSLKANAGNTFYFLIYIYKRLIC